MTSVRTEDTAPEVSLRSELHRRGLRFRKHPRGLPGKPDLVFTRARTVVFIDGDFWHGRNFDVWGPRLPDFWRAKIGRNIERDRTVDEALTRLGWSVVRVWERDIKKDVTVIADLVERVRNERIQAVE